MKNITSKTTVILRQMIRFGAIAAAESTPVLGQATYVTPYAITTIAGRAGDGGTNDGIGSVARFGGANSIAADSATNLYVSDGDNSIRKITKVGTTWVVTTIAGLAGNPGSADGTNMVARFNAPDEIAVDAAGNIYVPDLNNNTIRMVTPVRTNWVVTTLAGKAPYSGSADGTASAARFNGPESVTVDSATNIYVADTGNNTIRKITLVGTNWVVTTIAGTAGALGISDGTNCAARFDSPDGITVDSETNLYVADETGNTIRKITPVGTNWVVTTIAGLGRAAGSADGIGSAARFDGPSAMAVDSVTNLYVPDIVNNTIRKVTPIGTNWVVTTLAGKASYPGIADGTGGAARFNGPNQVAVDGAGNLYVADAENSTIRKGTPPLIISSPVRNTSFTNGQFALALNGLGGQAVVVDASSDLENWLPIWTNTLTFPAAISFSDAGAGSNSIRFYRARTP